MTQFLGGKKKRSKTLKGGGGFFNMLSNAAGTALNATKAAAVAGMDTVKGTAAPKAPTATETAPTAQAGGHRRRRTSRRGSSSRRRRVRSSKVRRHATRSYRRKKRTRRA